MAKQDRVAPSRCIRGGLESDRDRQRRIRENAQIEPFGVFRPLTPDSLKHVSEVTDKITEKATSYLAKNRKRESSKLNALDKMGATFVPRYLMVERLRMFKLGFDFARLLSGIKGVDDGVDSDTLEVAIDGVGWYGMQSRKLAIQFFEGNEEEGDSQSFTELSSQRCAIDSMFRQLDAPNIRVAMPDHVTFVKYGHAGDGLPLSKKHKDMIADIAQGEFDRAGLTSVALGGVVIGKGYTQDLPIIGRL